MIKNISLTLVVLLTLIGLPFIGGSGPSPFSTESYRQQAPGNTTFPAATIPQASIPKAIEAEFSAQKNKTIIVNPNSNSNVATSDSEHIAQKPVPPPPAPAPVAENVNSNSSYSSGSGTSYHPPVSAAAPSGGGCPASPGGGGSAPGITDSLGQGMITGTTTSDIQSFSTQYNAVRAQHCLTPIPPSNFRYDSCMEQRLFWMAEDPSLDPSSAWGHIGSVRSDGVPSRGCDGNLAGGSGNVGATVAQKWWDSLEHRLSLYRPSYTGSTAHVCIFFAMSHGGIPNEPSSFTRAASYWGSC